MTLAQGCIPQQSVSKEGVSFPHVFVPASEDKDTDALLQAITRQKKWVDECLHVSGAVLFRGFAVNSASDFEHVVDALGYEQHECSGGAWLLISGPKVSKVDLPVEIPLDYHNEGAFLPNPPSKMMLFCEVEPPHGQGATPLLQGHVLYKKMKKHAPDFVQQIRDKKLVYSRALTEEGWKFMLCTDNKEEAEKRVSARMDAHIKWLADGGAFWYSNPREGVVRDEPHGRMVWFNSIAAMTQMVVGSVAGSQAPTFGDGSLLPEDGVRKCREIAKQIEVAIPWCKGDVLLLDNTAVMHSRQPCNVERSILLSLAA